MSNMSPASDCGHVLPGPVSLQPETSFAGVSQVLMQQAGSSGPSLPPQPPPPHLPGPQVDFSRLRQSLCHDHIPPHITLPSVPTPLPSSLHPQLPIAQVPTLPSMSDHSSLPPLSGSMQKLPLVHQLPLNTMLSPTEAVFSNCPLAITPPAPPPPPCSNPMVTNLANSILASVFTGLHNTGTLDTTPLPPPPSLPSCSINQGTLISPATAAGSNAFVRVEDFLVPIPVPSSKQTQQELISGPEINNLLQARPGMSGIGFLANSSGRPAPPLPPPPSLPLPSFGSLVSQRPIPSSQKPVPSVVTTSNHVPQTQVPHSSTPVTVSTMGAINPSAFLSHNQPAQAGSTEGSGVPMKIMVSVAQDGSLYKEVSDSSPPKRPRLE